MKNKYLNSLIVALVILLVFGCSTNEDDLMQPYITGTVIPEITEVNSAFFDILDVNEAYIDFTVTTDMNVVESLSIEKTFQGTTTELGNYTSVPVNIKITAEQAVADIEGLTIDDLKLGDTFIFEVIVKTKSGLRTRSNAVLAAPLACKSDLAGAVTYEIIASDLADLVGKSGTLSWEEIGTGMYDWDSFTFGGYQALYGCCELDRGATQLFISDICNVLSMKSLDQYECGWGISSIDENTETVLTLTINGECLGFYQIKFTRDDGKNWPPFTL